MSRSLYQIQKSVLLLSFSSLSGGTTANGIDGPLVVASTIDGSVLRRFILFLIFFNIVACVVVVVVVVVVEGSIVVLNLVFFIHLVIRLNLIQLIRFVLDF